MFDWTRRTGPTGSSGTGPTSDHTYATLAGTFIVSPSMKFSKLLEVSGYTIYGGGGTLPFSLFPLLKGINSR